MLKMSLTKLQDIAKAGKTAKYNIKIGDHFPINDIDTAEIVAIGNDYITCITKIEGQYKYYNSGKSNRLNQVAIVGYHNSDLRKAVNDWFDKQSNGFKSIVKDTVRNYEMHQLSCVTFFYDEFSGHYPETKHYQNFYGFLELTEKTFIPTTEEFDSLIKNSNYNKKYSGWTSTPVKYDGFSAPEGYFLTVSNNTTGLVDGGYREALSIMFNIG